MATSQKPTHLAALRAIAEHFEPSRGAEDQSASLGHLGTGVSAEPRASLDRLAPDHKADARRHIHKADMAQTLEPATANRPY